MYSVATIPKGSRKFRSLSGGSDDISAVFEKLFSKNYEPIYKQHKKAKERKLIYEKPSSDQQIGSILRQSSKEEYFRLCQVLAKMLPAKMYRKFLSYELSNYTNDSTIYKKIADIDQKKDAYVSRDTHHVDLYVGQLKTLKSTQHLISPDTIYLDVGCGTCTKAKVFGDALGTKHIYGTDIKQWANIDEKSRENLDITFKFIENPDDPIIPYESDKFDFITAFMVLHHVKNLDKFLSEIYRCLKPNGFFMMREHDVYDAIDRMLVDIEHLIFDYKDGTVDFDKYYIKCFAAREWDAILLPYKFHYIKADYDYMGLKKTISPTRYFRAIYQKMTEAPPEIRE